VDPVRAWVGFGTGCDLDLATRLGAEHLRELADAVVLPCRAHIHRLGADEVLRRLEDRTGNGRDAADVYERTPGGAVAQEPYAARRVRPRGEVVEDDVEPQPR